MRFIRNFIGVFFIAAILAGCAANTRGTAPSFENPFEGVLSDIGGFFADETAPPEAQGRIYFLLSGEAEPQSPVNYAYLIIGPKVAAHRRFAVAQGAACHLDVAADAEAVEALEAASLLVAPARRAPELIEKDEAPNTFIVSPRAFLSAYDDRRAGRWLAATAQAFDVRFDPEDAILFVSSNTPLAKSMDAFEAAQLRQAKAAVLDASGLSGRHLTQWMAAMVAGVKRGELLAEDDFGWARRSLAFLEISADAAVGSLFRAAPAQAADIALINYCP